MKYIFVIAIIITTAIVSFIIYNNIHEQSYKNTWWTGSTNVRLCKVPYYSNEECSVVSATSTDNRITRLQVSGSNFNIYESECFQAATSSDGLDRFCRISESGQRYDVLPL